MSFEIVLLMGGQCVCVYVCVREVLTGESGEALATLLLVSEQEGEAGSRDRVLQTQELVEWTHVQEHQLGERQCVLQ